MYVGHTSQQICDRIKQHVPSSIRQKTLSQREQPSRASKTKRTRKHAPAMGQHLAIEIYEYSTSLISNSFAGGLLTKKKFHEHISTA